MKKKGILAAALAAGCLQLFTVSGADAQILSWVQERISGGQLITATLNVELGATPPAESLPPETPPPSAEPSPAPTPTAAPAPTTPPAEGILPTTIDGGLTIKNTSTQTVDLQALMAETLQLTLPAEGPQILIIHTHGSEAYTPEGGDTYTPSGESRTQDKSQNIIRVGDELAACLEQQGLRVLHDREIYDYPSYTGSYSRSGAAVEQYLAQYPALPIVIDLHRDALGTGDVIYKTMAEIPGQASAQIMLLAGTGENGLSHPYWRENLKLALHLQAAACNRYATLMRPVSLVPERYNLHLTTGSLIMEVGSAGNTLQEALRAVRLFAEAAGPALLELTA